MTATAVFLKEIITSIMSDNILLRSIPNIVPKMCMDEKYVIFSSAFLVRK